MDPGAGLFKVTTPSPTKNKAPPIPAAPENRFSDSSKSSSGSDKPVAPIDPTKKHVAGALKFLKSDEDRAKALEGAAKWKAMFAAQPRWKEAVDSIQRFANEDPLRVIDTGTKEEEKCKKGNEKAPQTAKGKEKATHTTPDLPEEPAAVSSYKSRLPRPTQLSPTGTGHAASPRERWDVVTPGPPTPLTRTPTGNAFAPGGIWSSLTPKDSPITPVPPTPITAIPVEPFSPIAPERDEASKATHDALKKEVKDMALKLCAARLNLCSALNSEGDGIHPSMVRPRDELAAAQQIVEQYAIKVKSKNLPTDVVATLHQPTEEENQLQALMQNKTLLVSARYEQMVALQRAYQDKKRSKKLAVSDDVQKYAWAVKILEDAEKMVKLQGDSKSDAGSDDDEGYDYSNFLRSLKLETSKSMMDMSAAAAGYMHAGDAGSIKSGSTLTEIGGSSKKARSSTQTTLIKEDAGAAGQQGHTIQVRTSSLIAPPPLPASLSRNTTGSEEASGLSNAPAEEKSWMSIFDAID